MALQLVTEGQQRGMTQQDIVATLTALTAHSIADAYRRFAPAPPGEVIVSGGGSSNPALMQMIRELVAPTPLLTHEDIGVSSDHKERRCCSRCWRMKAGTPAPAISRR
ncbi:MAG: anhydro-N-acetylmuramic acid kinase [Anaerolineae bacterium]